MHRVGRDFFYEEMKRERDGEDDKTTSIRIEMVDATPQFCACNAIRMILVDPDEMSWEDGQKLTIEDVTAIRALRKTIKDNLVPIASGSAAEWKATIAAVVDEFSRMPMKYTGWRDQTDEDGYKNMIRAIQGMATGKPLADIKKQYEEDEQRDAKKKKEADKETK